ncbi:MAG: short-chain fatty acyl-CoA regulator family protein [Qingshengfaniella sp.]
MPRVTDTGARIRERRGVLGIRQADLARTVEISPSYLNLIEHNRRRVGGKLLVRIARALSMEVAALTQGAEAEMLDRLSVAALAQPSAGAELDRIDELVSRFPGWAQLAMGQQRQIAALEEKVAALTDRLTHDPFLSATFHDLLSKVASIRSTAAILAETEDLDVVWQRRFRRNLAEDSLALSDGAAAMVAYLEAKDPSDLGIATPQEELEAYLAAGAYHVPALECEDGAAPEDLVGQADLLRSDEARRRARLYLDQYRCDARTMPLGEFGAAAAEERFDPARLARRFAVDIPAVFRRLASLPRQALGVELGLVICDGAGALIFRKPAEGFPLPRFGASCPLWPLFQALSHPMTPIRTVLEHVSSPDEGFVTFAFCQPEMIGGFGDAAVQQSMMLIAPAGMVPGAWPADAELVGSSCRICHRLSCPARREDCVLADGI